MATTFSGEQAIEALYVGYFGRAGDPSGISYWLSQLNSGLSITQIAASFSVQTESTSLYSFLANPGVGGSAAVTNFITQVYQDLFNRAPDSSGLAYWTAQLQAANGSPQAVAQFILNVITGAQGTDQTTIQNKVTVAQDFTDSLSAANGQYNGQADTVAHSVVKNTTSDPATVTTQEAAVTAFTGQAITGKPFSLTTGIDTVNGFNLAVTGVLAGHGAATNTLNVGDQFNPTGTNNSLTITSTAAGVVYTSADIPTLNNVQAFNVNNVGAGTTQFTLTGVAPSVSAIGVSGLGSTNFTGYSGTQVTTFNVTNITAPAQEFFQADPGQTSGGKATGTATLNLSGDAATGGLGNALVIFASASATDGTATLNVNSNGPVANDLNTLQVNNTLTTLNVAGAAALKVDNMIGFAGGVVNIQAGTDTGGLNLDVSGNGGKATFVGGTAGTEKLTISDASLTTAGTSLAGGAGTSDTLTVSGLTGGATDIAALNKVTGFEILGVNGAVTLDDSQITATFQNHFAVSGGGALTVNNLVNGATIDILNSSTDVFSGAVGATVVTINEGAATGAGGQTDNLTVTGLTTVTLSSNGAAANTANFTNSDNTSFTLAGVDGLTMTVSAAATTGDKVDASALIGALTYTDSGKGDVILGGAGTTSINARTAASVVDTITLLSGHTKVDTITTTKIDSTGLSTTDKVTNFALNQDVLSLTGQALTQGTELGATAGTGVIASGAFASLSAFLTSANATVGVAGHAVAWSDGTNTFVAEFTAAATNSVHVVELVGTTGVTAVGGTGAGHLLIV